MFTQIIEKIDNHVKLTRDDLIFLLSLENSEEIQTLYDKAYRFKRQVIGNKVHFRGIIEFSNICTKDCYYCGIRKSNGNVDRFTMDRDEILEAAIWAHQNAYGSLVLQSGERSDEAFVDFIESLLQEIKEHSQGELGITLSLGEQSKETYQRWYDAGAHRYLLRIESSNPELYAKLHPADHSHEIRKQCLSLLRDVGYQVGTGVMIGLPGQTTADLADDILFFESRDIDMIGMGPYIPHSDTPLGADAETFDTIKERQLTLGLKMIAVTRLYLQDVNIAATTALQALHPKGREKGLQAGANIIMPNVTATQYRVSYQLYDGKPCINENSSLCRGCLENRIGTIGESIGFNEWGDSQHFKKRQISEIS